MLRPDTGLPLYRQLAATLRERVKAGEFQPGARIPSEPTLSRDFGIARPTVRQATELLVREGLLERRRGAGTFVLERPAAVDLLSLDGTLKAFAAAGGEVAFQVAGPIAPRPVEGLEFAAIDPGEPVLALERLGRIGALLVARETLWLSGHALMPLAGVELADDASLSAEIESRLDVRALRARQWVRAVLVDARLEEPPAAGHDTPDRTRADESPAGGAPIDLPLDAALAPPLAALVIEREIDLDAAGAAVTSRLVCRADHIVLHPPDGGLPHGH